MLTWQDDRAASDRHVLVGNDSIFDLHDVLEAFRQPVNTFLSSHAGTTLRFEFVSLKPGQNITLDPNTGIVTVSGPPPTDLNNFIVAAVLTEPSPTPGVLPAVHRAYIRFHVHQSITKAWLTPSPLTVYKGIGFGVYGFSVYAQFDDGVIGDLTYCMERIIWSPATRFSTVGRIIIVSGDPDGVPIAVTATLPAQLGAVVTSGEMIPRTPPDKAELITTGKSPGFARRNEVPNILFLPDGFLDMDRAEFEKITDDFVRRLSAEKKTRPYDILADSINYWRAFVPSRERGISVASEVYLTGGSGPFEAFPLSFSQPTVLPATGSLPIRDATVTDLNLTLVQHWNFENLTFFVGQPVPNQKPRSYEALRFVWKQTLTVPPNLIDAIPDKRIEDWKSGAERRLINEKDTFLGTFRGRKPRAVVPRTDDPELFKTNDLRVTRSELNSFLNNLKHGGNALGGIWDSRVSPRGKDFDLVVFLVNSKDGRGVNREGFFFTNVRDTENKKPIKLERDVGIGDKAVWVNIDRPPEKLPQSPFGTLIHEITHSLTIGDEYGEAGIDINHSFFRFSRNISVVEDNFANLQAESDALNAAGFVDGGRVKWRWHRMKKCAVLSAPIVASGSNFVITLQAGQTSVFNNSDQVRLRFRRFGTPLTRVVRVSSNLTVTGSPAGNQVTVTGPLTPGDFPPGSILYQPLPSPHPTDPNYPLAELISKPMIDYLTSVKRPLSSGTCVIDDSAIQMPNLDAFPVGAGFCKKHTPRLVGLYAGGMQFHCGVFHPTGVCMMRDHYESTAEFCVVCRYIIVDQVNPAKHPEIDKDYDLLVGPESPCC